MITIRTGYPGEDAPFRALWKAGFGDTDGTIDQYFSIVHQPENGMLLFVGAQPAAMTMMVPCALAAPDGSAQPASCIYAFTTHPEYQGRGLGLQLLDAAIAELHARGIPHVVLHPASESLYNMYRDKSGFTDAFFVREQTLSAHPAAPAAQFSLRSARPGEYLALRERLLAGHGHIVWSETALALQKCYNQDEGGDLYICTYADTQVCVCAAPREGQLLISELLAPEPVSPEAAAQAICHALGFLSGLLRVPKHAELSAQPVHFGMLCGVELPYCGYFGIDFN